MKRLDELGLLAVIHPQLSFRSLLGRMFAAAKRAYDWYELLYTGERCHRWQVFFLCLFSELDNLEVQQVVKRLGMPPRHEAFFGPERDAAHRVINQLEWRSQQRLDLRDSEIFTLLKDLQVETLLYGMARTEHEETRRIISHFITHLRQIRCLLSGRDLQSMGLEPGPVFREVFKCLLAARLDGKLVTREDEIQFVAKRFLGKSTENQIQ